MLTRCFELILLLNLTGLFSFVAIQLGIPIAAMSGAILAFLLLYLLVHWQHALWFARKKDVFLWIVFVFAWPALTLLYAEVRDLRANAINLYLVALMLSTAIWLSRVGITRARGLFVTAGVIVILGLLLSLIRNDYFQAVAEAADARFAYLGRAFGFFLQPNMAAQNTSFLYAILLPIVASRRSRITYLTSGVFAAAVLLTGSRGGIIIGLSLVIYVHILAEDIARRGVSRKFWGKLGAVFVIALALLSANEIAKVTSVNSHSSPSAESTLTDRIGAMASLDLVGGGLGESAAARYIALVEHWQGITQRPLLGFGVAASNNFSSTGRLTFSSHNLFVQIAFDLGLPAVALLLYLLYRLWKSARTAGAFQIYGINPAMTLLIAIVLASMFSNSILYSRVFFAVLGAMFALRYWPVPMRRTDDLV